MNKSNFLFLFFFVGIFNLLIYSPSSIYAQDGKDSLRYYHKIIVNPKNSKEINAAFSFFEKRIQKKLDNHDTISAIQDLRRVAIGQFELGFFYESEATAVRAIKLLDSQVSSHTTAEAKKGLNNHLGMIYRNLKLYSKALPYYQTALRNASNENDSIAILNNVANIYLDQEDFVKAENIFIQVFQKSMVKNTPLVTARALNNLGFTQSKLHRPEALDNMISALTLRQKENDVPGMYSSYNYLSRYYLSFGNREKAINYANEAYNISKILNSASYIENALSLLLDLDENPKVIEYKKLRDSIVLAKQTQENKYASIKYDVEKEKQKTRLTELQREKEKQLKLLYFFIASLAILGIVFSIYYKNQQKKRAAIESEYKAEIRMGKKVHDEVGNDIFYLMTQIQNNPKLLFDNNGFVLLEGLDKVYQKARDITKKYTPIKTDENFGDELMALLNSYGNDHIKVITKELETSFWNAFSRNQKLELFWIVRELMTNMRKYSKASFVGITFTKVQNQIELNYTDNGVGFNNNPTNWGTGLKSVETRIKNLNGNFSFDSTPGKGVSVKIKFPV